MLKQCTKCRLEKPLDAFVIDRRRQDGRNPWCRSCVAVYYRATRNDRLAVAAAYRAAHREELAADTATRRAAKPEKAREATRRYREDHREALRAKSATYRAAHPEKWVGYRLAQPEKVRAQNHRRRALMRGTFVEIVQIEQLALRDRDSCGICGRRVPRSERSIDHILPLSKGGEHSYANTRLTHLRCNLARKNRGAAQLRLLG